MTTSTTEPAGARDQRAPLERAGDADDDELVAEDEVLIEEISIDGMCGVY